MKTPLTLLLTALLVGWSAGQFTRDPPYTADPGRAIFPVDMDPAATGCRGDQCDVRVTVSVPNLAADAEDPDRPAPFPVIIFVNGFQLKVTSYRAYADILTSWGYAVVQYQVPTKLIPIGVINDRDELKFFEPLLDALKEKNEDDSQPFKGLLNLNRIGIAGHSRGAKLALLHFLAGRVETAFLIEPVDNSGQTPASDEFPDAIGELDAKEDSKKVGIVGAEIIGGCQPRGENFNDFWDAAKKGSWLSVVAGAGHQTFVENAGLAGVLCGSGPTSFREAVELVEPSIVHWFDRTFYRTDDPAVDREFRRWGEEKEATGDLVEFSFKE